MWVWVCVRAGGVRRQEAWQPKHSRQHHRQHNTQHASRRHPKKGTVRALLEHNCRSSRQAARQRPKTNKPEGIPSSELAPAPSHTRGSSPSGGWRRRSTAAGTRSRPKMRRGSEERRGTGGIHEERIYCQSIVLSSTSLHVASIREETQWMVRNYAISCVASTYQRIFRN